MLALFFKMTTAPVAVPRFLTLPFIVRLPSLPMLHGCYPSLPGLSLLPCVPFLQSLLLWVPFLPRLLLLQRLPVPRWVPMLPRIPLLVYVSSLVTQVTSASGFMKTRQKYCATQKFPVWFAIILWHSFCISDCYLANHHHYGFMVVLILTWSEFKFQPTWLRFMLCNAGTVLRYNLWQIPE
jgi:hypothetical protein